MGKRACPKWVTFKEKCKCGLLFYPVVLIGGRLTKQCQNCNPEAYLPQKK